MHLPKLFLSLFLFLLPHISHADSPLTSTPFHEAFLDMKIVRYAKEKGVMDKKIAKCLLSKRKSVGLKAAVINALGWDIDGKKNAEIFLGFLTAKRGITADNREWDALNASDLMCMGYLMAMDNYFDCEAAEKVLFMAREKDPGSFTIAFMHSLVLAQVLFDSDWCLVWQAVNEVYVDKNLVREMHPPAIKIVMDYIELYKEEC